MSTAGLRRMSGCISVSELDRSVDWYRAALGFEVRDRADFPELAARLAFLQAGDLRLELVESAGSAPPPQRPDPPRHGAVRGVSQLALYVDDLDPMLTRLAGIGVRPAMPPTTVPELGLRACFVRDVDGNLIELIQELGPTGPEGPTPTEQENPDDRRP